MRLIALIILIGWLTLPANAQTRDAEVPCGASLANETAKEEQQS